MRSGGRLGFVVVAASVLAACGSSQPASTSTTASASTVSSRDDDERARQEQLRRERAEREEIATAHRKLESEQQDALAATCDAAKAAAKPPRCLPSCYALEAADPRAGTKLTGPVAIEHLVCQQTGGADAYVIADELAGGKLTAKPVRGKFPKLHKKGSWQESIETALAGALMPAPAAPASKGKAKSKPKAPASSDVIVVTGAWKAMTHPATKEKLRCVTVAHYAKSVKKPLDACGGDGTLGCEAIGDGAAHGINVVHYRLVEARRLQAAGKDEDCQQAALEAVAVARGMPRWRQYAKLNVDQWADRAVYKTRFDGLLDEDTLFATATTLGQQAEAVFTACGGAAGAPTTVEQEQSFHTCP